MKTLKYWLSWERCPSFEQLPMALVRAAVSGLITGGPVGLLLLLLLRPEHVRSVLHLNYWLLMMATGAIFSLSFYVTCGLPQSYLTNLAASWPQRRIWIARGMLGAAGGMAGLILAANALRFLLPIKIMNLDQFNRMIAIDAVIGAVLALLMGAWIQKDLREKSLREATARAQAQALQAQIQPHFFFNTMNTVQALIDTDAAEAKRVIGRLSGMFRYALASSQNSMAPIGDELSFVRDYLEIEKVRFGERLHFELPSDAGEFTIPSLSLQPLVENAVRHGVARCIEGGEVAVRIAMADGLHSISVWSPVDGNSELDPSVLFRTGHALENIRRRLELIYGARAAVHVERRGANQVEAVLRIPCES